MSNRTIALGEETEYGTAVSPTRRYLLVSESLKRKPVTRRIRAERRGSANRQSYSGVSVQGAVDVYTDHDELGRLLKWLVNTPSTTNPAGSARVHVFDPSASYRPPSLTAHVYRDVAAHQFTGLFPTAGRLSFSTRDRHFGLSLQMLGADESDGGAIPDVSPSAFPVPAQVSAEGGCTLSLVLADGSTTWNAWAESFEVDVSFDRRLRLSERSYTPSGIVGGGICTASGKVKWYYDEDSAFLLDAMRSRSDVSLTLTLKDGTAITGSYYPGVVVSLPLCKVNSDPPTLKSPGIGNIDFSVDLDALESDTAPAIRFTVTNTAASY